MYDSVKRAIENADANSAGRLCFVFSPQQISSCEMKKNLNTICRDIKHTKSIITRTVLTRCFPPSDYTSRHTGMEC